MKHSIHMYSLVLNKIKKTILDAIHTKLLVKISYFHTILKNKILNLISKNLPYTVDIDVDI